MLRTSTTVPLVVTWAMTEEEVLTMKSGTIKQPECSVDLSGKFSMLSGLCATMKYVTKTVLYNNLMMYVTTPQINV